MSYVDRLKAEARQFAAKIKHRNREYRRTRAMGPVWLEHVTYGLLLFTIGLGEFFYDGRP